MAVDLSQYKVGIILSLEGCGVAKSKMGKALKACTVNVGDEENPVTIVTSASNVRHGSRVVVALAGTTYINEEGEEAPVKKVSVGGVLSEGMLCDSKMLGWSGGGSGVAAQIPDSFPVGVAPPPSKPRREEEKKETKPEEVKGLFEKKLTKEEKKKLAEERRKARQAKKAAKKAHEEEEEPSNGNTR